MNITFCFDEEQLKEIVKEAIERLKNEGFIVRQNGDEAYE